VENLSTGIPPFFSVIPSEGEFQPILKEIAAEYPGGVEVIFHDL
jgi:hypothetical protein